MSSAAWPGFMAEPAALGRHARWPRGCRAVARLRGARAGRARGAAQRGAEPAAASPEANAPPAPNRPRRTESPVSPDAPHRWRRPRRRACVAPSDGCAPPAGVTLTTPIQSLKGIGPVRARLYTRLGIHTVGDLLFHFPARHQAFSTRDADRRPVLSGRRLRARHARAPRSRKPAARAEATESDRQGPHRHRSPPSGCATASRAWAYRSATPIALSGKLVQQGRQLTFENPDYERGDGPPLHTRGLVPVHPLTAGLTDRELRTPHPLGRHPLRQPGRRPAA